MTNENSIETTERLPVSRIQRFLPLLSYSLMALGGAAGGYYALRVVGEFANAENAGIGRIGGYLASGLWSLTTGLVLALVVGFVAVIVHIGMLFTARKTASPSPLIMLVPAFIGMLSIVLSWQTLDNILIDTVVQAGTTADLVSSSRIYAIAAIALGLLTPVIALILSFSPIKGKPGRSYATLILTVILEAVMLVYFSYLSWQISSITRMMLGH